MIFFFGMFLALWGARTTDVAIARLQDRIAAEAQKPDEDSGERRPAGQVRPK
jgi:hypothetical protein